MIFQGVAVHHFLGRWVLHAPTLNSVVCICEIVLLQAWETFWICKNVGFTIWVNPKCAAKIAKSALRCPWGNPEAPLLPIPFANSSTHPVDSFFLITRLLVVRIWGSQNLRVKKRQVDSTSVFFSPSSTQRNINKSEKKHQLLATRFIPTFFPNSRMLRGLCTI